MAFKELKSRYHELAFIYHPDKNDGLESLEKMKDLFKGKNIVFSGETMYSRNELIVMGKKYGANIKTSISKKVDYLVEKFI